MKNLLLPIAIVALFALSSCTKEYTCTCVQEVAGFDPVTTMTTFEAKKSDAEDSCAALDAVSSAITCTLD